LTWGETALSAQIGHIVPFEKYVAVKKNWRYSVGNMQN